MAVVYFLQSLKNNRFYIGSTIDLNQRIEDHNSGKSKYDKSNYPFKLVFSQVYDSILEARRIEYKLKKFKSKKIIIKIIKEGKIKLKL